MPAGMPPAAGRWWDRRPGHGVGADDVARHRHEQLGAGGDEPVDRHDVAARIRRAQPLQHRQPVDGSVGGHVDLPGQHDLVQAAARHRLRGPLDQGAPVVGVALGGDREPQDRCRRPPTRPSPRTCGAKGPHDGAICRTFGRFGRFGRFARGDGGEPPGAVVGPPDDHRGHDELARGRRRERQGPEGDRSAAGQPDLVVGVDGGQRRGHRAGGRRRVAAGPRHACGGAPAGEPGAAPLEQHAVAAGERQQVDVGVQPAGPGHEGRHDALVARMSWAIPPESRRRSTSAKPASATMRRSSSGAGR